MKIELNKLIQEIEQKLEKQAETGDGGLHYRGQLLYTKEFLEKHKV